MTFNTPVLLLIYNRVEETHNLFQIIKKVRPSKLYVGADGAQPNLENDYVTCLRTRSVIMPEWECELHENFQEEHLGKSRHIFTAISWFFEHEPEGIVLFDDTLPHVDFFPYCEQLLNKYRSNNEVMHIGASHLKKHKGSDASYYFSAYAFCWGFATWRRAWENFDLTLNTIDKENLNPILSKYMGKMKERMYWSNVFNILKKHNLDYWEFQYNMHIWKSGGLSITPNTNLVKNTGFKTRKRKIRKLMASVHPILPLRLLTEIKQNKKADSYTFRKIYNKAINQIFFEWIKGHLLKIGKKNNER